VNLDVNKKSPAKCFLMNVKNARGLYSPRIKLQDKNALSEMSGEMIEMREKRSDLSEMTCKIKCEMRYEMTEMTSN
jgi:hypothetical protein